MRKLRLTAIFFIVYFLNSIAVHAVEHHSGHGGNSNRGETNSGGACIKPQLAKFLPPHLATVAPEAEFSFLAFNIQKPEQITVTVKAIPVAVTAEYKEPFYVVKGKLPSSLKNTAARINVKVSAKTSHCELENGWLVKISDN
ncbi:MAG: hypothetical protein PHY16_01875 [Methylobacter sp.]|nr:hypothetical protein [Methylobacter sp.]